MHVEVRVGDDARVVEVVRRRGVWDQTVREEDVSRFRLDLGESLALRNMVVEPVKGRIEALGMVIQGLADVFRCQRR